LLLDFERQADLVHLQRIVDFRHVLTRKLDVDDRADALHDRSLIRYSLIHFVFPKMGSDTNFGERRRQSLLLAEIGI
jgi:hypothetical protein